MVKYALHPLLERKYHVGPPGYYTRVYNRPPFGEKKSSLEDFMNKHLEESARRIYDDAPINKASSNKNNENHRVSFIDEQEDDNLLSEDLGAIINVMPKSMFEHLKLANLKETNMLVEMANITKKDHWKEKFGEEDDDTNDGWEDPKKCGQEKIDIILDTVFDKLDDSWFCDETQDDDVLDGITDYLEPTSYDGFIDSEDECNTLKLGRSGILGPGRVTSWINNTRYILNDKKPFKIDTLDLIKIFDTKL
nr:hypothetical protein [Tanacetum cinerariifolium]